MQNIAIAFHDMFLRLKISHQIRNKHARCFMEVCKVLCVCPFWHSAACHFTIYGEKLRAVQYAVLTGHPPLSKGVIIRFVKHYFTNRIPPFVCLCFCTSGAKLKQKEFTRNKSRCQHSGGSRQTQREIFQCILSQKGVRQFCWGGMLVKCSVLAHADPCTLPEEVSIARDNS